MDLDESLQHGAECYRKETSIPNSLRVAAEGLGISQVDRAPGALRLRFDEETSVAPETLVEMSGTRSGAMLHPEGLVWPLEAGENTLEALGVLLETLDHSL